jgi:hypothetical protein
MVPDETDGFLMFLSNKAATFWIDDARLEDKTKAPAR